MFDAMRLTIELPERTLLLAAAALLLVWALLKLRRIRTVRCDTSRRNLKVRQLPSFTAAAADAAAHAALLCCCSSLVPCAAWTLASL